MPQTPGLNDILACDWQKAARFYARFGINETLFRNGVPAVEDPEEHLNGQGPIPS